MNSINISQKAKNKHLNFSHYEFIINSLIQFNACHPGKRNIGKTQFIKELASTVGTTALIYILSSRMPLSLLKTTISRFIMNFLPWLHLKRDPRIIRFQITLNLKNQKEFISLVEQEVKSNRLSSIDETINYLKLHQPDIIKNMVTVSTKTFYSYVHQGRTSIKPIDLPRMVRRKTKKNWKSYIPKRQKGTSITERPEYIKDREEFGHWEGDLVTGPRDGQNGAYLTLIERKTRFYYMIPISANLQSRFICR